MRIAGNYTFEATREEVWSALNDPGVLALVIPGCQRLDQIGPDEYESTLKVGLQAVRGVYNGRVKIDNQQLLESYDIHVDGKGNNGFLKGKGSIKLRPEGASTILDYGGEAQVGGTIASVGQRLLDGAAKTLINQSLKALAQQIEARRSGDVAPAPPEPRVTPPQPVAAPAAAAPDTPEVAAADTSAESYSAPTPTAAVAPTPAGPSFDAGSASFERRTIEVAEGQGLSDAAVARGMVEDFFNERPWAPWVIVALLVGYIFGRRK